MYRQEHPDPSRRHKSFINLNGSWEFEFDNELVGVARKYYEREHLDGRIEVPFCPESKLSGIGHTDFINAVWYRRDIDVPAAALDGTVLIHFGAIDYESVVYINGAPAATHVGGYQPITVDATKYLHAGVNSLCVYAKDNVRFGIPHGKQCEDLFSRGCDYTRTTGIWQTVYMELLPGSYIKNIRTCPDPENGSVSVRIVTVGAGEAKIEAFYGGKPVGSAAAYCGGVTTVQIKLSETHLWEVGHGRLYDLRVTFGDDVFESYFGLRSVRLEGKKFLINNKSVFQRLVLDQGFYPDGIYTAPSAEALENDVLLSQSLGFNGARLHMKVFEPLFLYYADKHGYLTWGEFPNWGLDYTSDKMLSMVTEQWLEELERDFNHPSIIGWCPLNETHTYRRLGPVIKTHDALLRGLYLITKAVDPTRPCIDTSGYVHQQYTDIYDTHDYEQDPAVLREHYAQFAIDGTMTWDGHNVGEPRRASVYRGQPLFISEFGGARWSSAAEQGRDKSWGYGNAPQTEEEFIDRFRGLCRALMENRNIFGFCYTQLYDIEQEQNGLLYYDRAPKFAPEKFREIMSVPAEIEK